MGYSTCPVCRNCDSAVSIQQAIFDGTNTQVWSGYSYNPMNSDGVTYSTMTKTTQTRLAAMLTPPPPPGSGLLVGFFLLGGMLAGVVYSMTAVKEIRAFWELPGGFLFAIGIGFLNGAIPGMLLGIAAYFVWWFLRLLARFDFNKRKKVFLASAYCYRCDVAWGEEKVALPIDVFVGGISRSDN